MAKKQKKEVVAEIPTVVEEVKQEVEMDIETTSVNVNSEIIEIPTVIEEVEQSVIEEKIENIAVSTIEEVVEDNQIVVDEAKPNKVTRKPLPLNFGYIWNGQTID